MRVVNKTLQRLTDVLGNMYIGVNIRPDEIIKYITLFLREYDTNNKFWLNRQLRDGVDQLHMTVFNVAECGKNPGLFEKYLDGKTFDLEIMGIGEAEAKAKGNKTYFLVIECPYLNGITDRDLHVTLGFDKKDVFGVPKNKVITKL